MRRVTHPFSTGFTLIELLVVMGIMGAMLLIGINGLYAVRDEQLVKQDTSQLYTILQLLRSQAVNGQFYDATNTYYGYLIKFSSNGNGSSYSVYKVQANVGGTCGSEITLDTYKTYMSSINTPCDTLVPYDVNYTQSGSSNVTSGSTITSNKSNDTFKILRNYFGQDSGFSILFAAINGHMYFYGADGNMISHDTFVNDGVVFQITSTSALFPQQNTILVRDLFSGDSINQCDVTNNGGVYACTN